MKKKTTCMVAVVLLMMACLPLHAQRTFDAKKKKQNASYHAPIQKPKHSAAPNVLQQKRTLSPLFTGGQHRILSRQSSSQLPSFITTRRNLAHAKVPTQKDPQVACFEYLTEIQSLTKLKNPTDNFRVARTRVDEKNTSHIRLNQFHRGIPVHGAEIIVHVNRFGQGEGFNGKYLQIRDDLSTTPSFDKRAAETIVKHHLNKDTHTFSSLEAQLVQYATPETGLCIYEVPGSNRPALAYHVKYSPSIHARWEYFVDAQNGNILHHINTTCFVDGPKTATANDLNGVSRTVHSYQKGSTFFMVDVSRSMYKPGSSTLPDSPVGGILTVDLNNTFGDNAAVKHITTTTNAWNTKSVSAHFNAGAAFEYYKADHSRTGIDGEGGTIISVINTPDEDGSGLDNAFWNGKAMFYGNGKVGFKPLAGSMDVAGHEMTHGVVENTANLEYEGESGAINESMADVFGALMDPNDWTIGEDVVKTDVFPSGALRSLEDPHNGGSSLSHNGYQPKHMNEKYTGAQDNGGVHINSGIPNHAFFLYATAITRAKAGKVYYKALTEYLTKSSQFVDLRNAVIQAATDLFGAGSNEVTQAVAAFNAVGIDAGDGGNYEEDIQTNPGAEYLLVYSTDPEDANSLYRIRVSDENIIALSSTTFISRPSVTDDGVVGVFVGTDHKIHAIITSPNEVTKEVILDNRAIWSNVVVSKGGNRLAAITEDPDQMIHIYDFNTEEWENFELYNPTYSDGVETGGPLYADAIEWDYSGEYLVYDAFNRIVNSDGIDIEYWDVGFIHAWDKASNTFGTGEISKLFASLPDGVSIGNASFSKNSPYILAFDMIDENTDEYAVLGVNIESNDVDVIFENNALGWPSFDKTDSHVAFTLTSELGDDMTGYVSLNGDKISSDDPGTELYNATKWPVFFAAGDRVIEEEETVTGIEEATKEIEFTAYPNPFDDQVTIKTDRPLTSNTNVEMFDLFGKPVAGLRVAVIDATTIQILAKAIPAGQYIVRINNGMKQGVKKVVKVR
ncbi:M4 family metallopeptidase [Pseudochryseolinea flava]|uniref:Metalloprotease n=1 Tax=Pseudochryseolinea flava TaxID=2059302 RepID=A0A364Y1M9_9BACT|nr:M4 family metallopeptidase [Pseudochryseolinea flava]RAW00614.1 metalloprotease [Pseudochryseolinea flava]